MASTAAPAIGGASGSGTPPLHSAWNPYSVLPPAARRKVDPTDSLKTIPYLEALSIPTSVASERLSSKFLQLDTPAGKISDRRKAELAKIEGEKEKKRRSRRSEMAGCGMVGRRKRVKLPDELRGAIRYDSILPIHQMWLGYMSELLGVPILLEPSLRQDDSSNNATTASTTSTLVPTFPPRPNDERSPKTTDLRLNVTAMHVKLVKAEFVGCILDVKRAKNPSLVGLKGIVLQETQSTFKIVTPKSKVKVLPKKGSVFTFSLPLPPLENSSTEATTAKTTRREMSFDIFGDAFAYRSAERVGRKWKAGSGKGLEMT